MKSYQLIESTHGRADNQMKLLQEQMALAFTQYGECATTMQSAVESRAEEAQKLRDEVYDWGRRFVDEHGKEGICEGRGRTMCDAKGIIVDKLPEDVTNETFVHGRSSIEMAVETFTGWGAASYVLTRMRHCDDEITSDTMHEIIQG